MKILSLDTSSQNCTIAIVEVDETKDTLDNNFNILAEENSNDERTHSLKFMPLVDSVFKKANLLLDDINLITCCVGPGSFTGIRIGVASCKAFADSKDLKVTSATSLESLAYNEYYHPYVVSLIDAKNDNVYYGFYKIENNRYVLIDEAKCDNIDIVLENIKNVIKNNDISSEIRFVGNALDLFRDRIQSNLNASFSNLISFSNNSTQSAISLAKSGFFNFKDNKYGDSNYILPTYLRKSQAERNANGEK